MDYTRPLVCGLRSIPASAGEPFFSTRSARLPCLRSIPASAGEPCTHMKIPASAGEPRPPGLELSGLSPRVRGNPPPTPPPQPGRRSIPASAGEPDRRRSPRAQVARSIPASAGEPSRGCVTTKCAGRTVYPRECGGTQWRDYGPVSEVLTRVYPRECGGTMFDYRVWRKAPVQRSIPASAGEPSWAWSTGKCARIRGLSPRVRGNRKAQFGIPTMPGNGLSPRVRGNPTTG